MLELKAFNNLHIDVVWNNAFYHTGMHVKPLRFHASYFLYVLCCLWEKCDHPGCINSGKR